MTVQRFEVDPAVNAHISKLSKDDVARLVVRLVQRLGGTVVVEETADYTGIELHWPDATRFTIRY